MSNIDEIEDFFDSLDMYFDSDIGVIGCVPFFIEPYNPYVNKSREQKLREQIELEEMLYRLNVQL